MMLDGAEECQLSGPIGELVPYTSPHPLGAPERRALTVSKARSKRERNRQEAGAGVKEAHT